MSKETTQSPFREYIDAITPSRSIKAMRFARMVGVYAMQSKNPLVRVVGGVASLGGMAGAGVTGLAETYVNSLGYALTEIFDQLFASLALIKWSGERKKAQGK
jgi:hypothetical protein